MIVRLCTLLWLLAVVLRFGPPRKPSRQAPGGNRPYGTDESRRRYPRRWGLVLALGSIVLVVGCCIIPQHDT